MLPPGHIAAGFLTAYGVLHFTQPAFAAGDMNTLLVSGAVLGALPDIDILPFFRRQATLYFNGSDTHRRYITHAPLPWLILGLIIAYAASNPFLRALGILLWLAPWSHFLCDSIEFGVRWLWPFSHRYFSITDYPKHNCEAERSLRRHYWCIIRTYAGKSRAFPLEVMLILAALVVISSLVLS
ncbi:MAG: metal-dependent hydrolase [Candidatus Liptonbacteria bacterium]|nr:metal-dependent hydrolase [Candidatus Liptonbacteria bacterium]